MSTMGKTTGQSAWLLTIGKSNDTTYDLSPVAYVLDIAGTYVDKDIAVSVPAATTGTSQSGTAVSTITPGTANKYVNMTAGYTAAKYWTIKGDANLISSNIAQGVTIFGVTGSHSGGITPSGTYAISSVGSTATGGYYPVSQDISSYKYVKVLQNTAANSGITVAVPTSPSVSITSAATGFTPSQTATSYYITITGTPSNGQIVAEAGISDVGWLDGWYSSNQSPVSPSVSGSGAKVYLPIDSKQFTGISQVGTYTATNFWKTVTTNISSFGLDDDKDLFIQNNYDDSELCIKYDTSNEDYVIDSTKCSSLWLEDEEAHLIFEDSLLKTVIFTESNLTKLHNTVTNSTYYNRMYLYTGTTGTISGKTYTNGRLYMNNGSVIKEYRPV